MPSYPFNAADGLCAGAAQAAALCTLVIRGALRGLTKAVSRTAAAEHALSIALNAVGGRVFQRKACARARAFRPRGIPGPLCGRKGVRAGAGGPGPLWGSEVPAVSSDLPLLRGTWRLRTHPQAGNGSGAIGLVRKEPDRWGLATPSSARSYGQLHGSCLAAVRVGIPATGYRQWPPGPPWGRYVPTSGATSAIWLCIA